MGKVVGLVGAASGKIGNIVYAVMNGIQTARVYQPIISNPKSIAQRLQRAKGNLAGRISQVVPREILLGLGRNNRQRRARFLSNCLKRATATESAGGFTAKLQPADFIFSEGAVVPAFNIGAASAYASQVTVPVQRAANVSDEYYAASGVLVVMAILASNGGYESFYYRFLTADEVGSEIFNIPFSHPTVGGYEAVVWFAPFHSLNGSVTTTARQLYGDEYSFAAITEYLSNASSVDWGMSEVSSTVTFTPAP